jgi:hypothetical protein
MIRAGSRGRILGVAAVVAASAVAGCGTTAPASPGPASGAAQPSGLLNATLTTTAGSWAVVVMGGSAARHNNFWQLFTHPAGSTSWRLATPPGTADNGGLVVAGAGSAMIAAIRPSQYLTFTPLARTTSTGQAWSALSPLGERLADSPDSLALGARGTSLLALLTNGTAAVAASPSYATWHTLASQRALAGTPAGRRCGLRSLTAAAFTQAGAPLLAGACTRPGTVGIFTTAHRTWRATGPPLPAAAAGQRWTVLRLTQAAGQLVALLAAGTGHDVRLLAAWSANGSRWSLAPPFPLRGAALASASLGPGGMVAVTLAVGRGAVITPGRPWQAVPRLPPGTATLAVGRGGDLTAFGVSRSTLTIWQARPGAAGWARLQVIHVPIQYGSSG